MKGRTSASKLRGRVRGRRRTECCEIETGYKARTKRKKGPGGTGDKVRRASTFGRFEDNLHYSRGKFLPWRVNGSLGPEIRLRYFLFILLLLLLLRSAAKTSGKEVKIRIAASILYFVISDTIE